MSWTSPDWLTQRGGEIRLSKDGNSLSLYFDGQLQYVLVPVPAKGQFGCRVSQTINGERLDPKSTFSTFDEALRGGLDEVRKALGW
jgi:hypothetical protein